MYVQLKPGAGKSRSGKTWERGAPDVAVEIVSPSHAPSLAGSEKLERYQSLGVRELVRFDPEARPGEPALRIWDRVEDRLLERDLSVGPGALVGPGCSLGRGARRPPRGRPARHSAR